MYNISDMKAPYQAVIRGNWKDLETFFDHDINAFKILLPMTVAKDTAFHIAVHSKTDQLLKYLLERVEQVGDPMGANVFITNDYENTVLHEAAINYNITEVKLLVEKNYVKAEQLLKRNRSGQTSLFKAASFGSTKVVRYLASQPGQTTRDENNNTKLADAHHIRNDGISILHAAVRGEHFGIPTGHDNNDHANNIDDDDGYVKTHDNNVANNIDNDDGYVKAGDNQCKNLCSRLKIYTGLETINKSLWKYLIGAGPPTVKKIWEEERKRKFAFELAQDQLKKFRGLDRNIEIKDKKTENSEKVISENQKQIVIEVEEVPETPLLAATRTGMIEIVKAILKEHPQAVEHISPKKQNILHVAASYRQKEVFEHVKEMKIPTSRLILGIDDESYTVLQHVADTANYHGGTRYGPAYQLQEELEWFKRVEDIMPSFFTKHRDKRDLTAKELFIEKHSDKLKEAQKWIKQTSQSCSQVAVLVATVVFAAAFTVPGGTDDKNGTPILLNSPFFLFFSISDVISLSSSLTAVVMFLSILTSSFELDDFHRLLPRRLTLGFALLFMSVATTMLAFTSTVILIIHLDKRPQWTLTLICCAAYFPVSVLALTHFPLFASFVNTLKDLFMAVWEAPPCRLVVGGLASVSNSVRRLLPKKNSDLEKGKD
ncbi:hypothetical protein ACOSQ2_013143 [Xanthoceras sorbifolium]